MKAGMKADVERRRERRRNNDLYNAIIFEEQFGYLDNYWKICIG